MNNRSAEPRARFRLVTLPLALCLGLVAILAPTAAHARSKPKVFTGHYEHEKGFEKRPAVIAYTGDGTGFVGGTSHHAPRNLGHIKWKKYSRKRGVGKAVIWVNNCRPDCADGKFSGRHGKVRVGRASHGKFRRMVLRYRYHGHKIVDKRKLIRSDGFYYWNIVA